MKVDIENGKYTYVPHDGGAVLLRHGEPWQDVTGQKVWYCVAYELQEAREERDALSTQVENWKDCAAQYARNEDFYRGIVRQIGELFGEEARTSDDGSVQDDVLALKVPELVEALAAHVERLRDAGAELVDLMDGVREGDYKPDSFTNQPMTEALTETPATSPARRDSSARRDEVESILSVIGAYQTTESLIAMLGERSAELRRQAEGGEA